MEQDESRQNQNAMIAHELTCVRCARKAAETKDFRLKTNRFEPGSLSLRFQVHFGPGKGSNQAKFANLKGKPVLGVDGLGLQFFWSRRIRIAVLKLLHNYTEV